MRCTEVPPVFRGLGGRGRAGGLARPNFFRVCYVPLCVRVMGLET